MNEILVERTPIKKGMTSAQYFDMRTKYLNSIVEIRRKVKSKTTIYTNKFQEYKSNLREVQGLQRKLEDALDRLTEVMDNLKK